MNGEQVEAIARGESKVPPGMEITYYCDSPDQPIVQTLRRYANRIVDTLESINVSPVNATDTGELKLPNGFENTEAWINKFVQNIENEIDCKPRFVRRWPDVYILSAKAGDTVFFTRLQKEQPEVNEPFNVEITGARRADPSDPANKRLSWGACTDWLMPGAEMIIGPGIIEGDFDQRTFENAPMSVRDEINQILDRQDKKGIESHGGTLDDNDLPALRLIDEAVEEAADLLQYLVALRRKMIRITRQVLDR